jgi:hypothetical protein
MFKSKVEILTLGLFQIENLIAQKVPFLLINISKTKNENLPPFLQNAKTLEEKEVEPYLKTEHQDHLIPVILLCSDGKTSQTVAQNLTRKIPTLNILTVEGGAQGSGLV